MFVLLSTYFYGQQSSKAKGAELVNFVKKNFDHKIIDMDKEELVNAISVECYVLEKMFVKSKPYIVSASYIQGEDGVLGVNIRKGDKNVPVAYLRFMHLEHHRDQISPIEIVYSASTT